MPKVRVTDREGALREIEAADGQTLMEVLRDAGYPEIEAVCGGQSSCATCHVLIAKDWFGRLPPKGEFEDELIEFLDSYVADQSRLSCQIPLSGDLDGLEVTIVEAE